jgi:hypothetical protein
MNLDEKEKKIRAHLIFEVIGKPKEHLVKALEQILEKLEQEKGVEIENKKVNEPVEMKNQEEFFSDFAEAEILVEDITTLNALMFKYMPAHVEIISPELIALQNNGWNEIFNDMLRKIHGYDEVTRVLQVKAAQMQKKINELEEKEKK